MHVHGLSVVRWPWIHPCFGHTNGKPDSECLTQAWSTTRQTLCCGRGLKLLGRTLRKCLAIAQIQRDVATAPKVAHVRMHLPPLTLIKAYKTCNNPDTFWRNQISYCCLADASSNSNKRLRLACSWTEAGHHSDLPCWRCKIWSPDSHR